MKRPLGWIGLIYLSSLAVIFYCYSTVLVIVLSVSAAVFAIAGVIFRLVKRDTKLHRYALVVGLTVLAATLYLFLYQNYIVQPVLSDYSGKEIYVEGYVCDELNISGKHPTCIVQTEKINGEERSVKITLALTYYLDLEQFDRVSFKVKPKASTFPYQFSRGIYLFATETEKSELTVGDEKRVTPYSFAVGLRRAVKKELTIALDNTAASVSKAVLLGDKHALDNDLKDAFTFTGTSYMILVTTGSLIFMMISQIMIAPAREAIFSVIFWKSLALFIHSFIGPSCSSRCGISSHHSRSSCSSGPYEASRGDCWS